MSSKGFAMMVAIVVVVVISLFFAKLSPPLAFSSESTLYETSLIEGRIAMETALENGKRLAKEENATDTTMVITLSSQGGERYEIETTWHLFWCKEGMCQPSFLEGGKKGAEIVCDVKGVNTPVRVHKKIVTQW